MGEHLLCACEACDQARSGVWPSCTKTSTWAKSGATDHIPTRPLTVKCSLLWLRVVMPAETSTLLLPVSQVLNISELMLGRRTKPKHMTCIGNTGWRSNNRYKTGGEIPINLENWPGNNADAWQKQLWLVARPQRYILYVINSFVWFLSELSEQGFSTQLVNKSGELIGKIWLLWVLCGNYTTAQQIFTGYLNARLRWSEMKWDIVHSQSTWVELHVYLYLTGKSL